MISLFSLKLLVWFHIKEGDQMKQTIWMSGVLAAVLFFGVVAEAPARERMRFDSDWQFVIDDRDLIAGNRIELKLAAE